MNRIEPMQLLVFVTDDGTSSGSGPVLFVLDDPTFSLPPNPRSLDWKYVGNISRDNPALATEGTTAIDAILRDGYYVSNRLVGDLVATFR